MATDPWTPLAAAARDALPLRVRVWHCAGTIHNVPVTYTIRNGVMRLCRDGGSIGLELDEERQVARAHCPAHAAWLDALDRVVALLPDAAVSGEVAQLLADLAHPRVRAAFRGVLPPPRRGDAAELLFHALQCEALDEAAALAETVADVDARVNGWTALLHAAQVGAEDVVAALLDAGADPRATTPEGLTGLHLVARRAGARPGGWSVTVRRDGALVTLTDPEAIRAATGRHPDADHHAAVRLGMRLLAVAPDLADAPTLRRQRPLSHAANYGADALVRRLLDVGVDVDARDRDGVSALAYATRNGHLPVVRRLLRAGADPNVRDAWGFTPLHDAAEAGRVEVVRALLAGGADPSIATTAAVSGWEAGLTPVDVARARREARVVGVLERRSPALARRGKSS